MPKKKSVKPIEKPIEITEEKQELTESKFKVTKKISKKDILVEEDKPKKKIVNPEKVKSLRKQYLSSKLRGTIKEINDDDKELEEYLQELGKTESIKNVITKEEEIAELFRKYDELGFGTLDSLSIRHLLTDLGFPLYKKYVDVIVRLMDQDGSDSIDYDEFSKWFHHISKNGFENMISKTEKLFKIWELFCSADDDHSGYLEFEECKTLIPVLIEECECRSNEFVGKEINHQDVLRLMHEIDDNGDGRLSFPELVHLMNVFE